MPKPAVSLRSPKKQGDDELRMAALTRDDVAKRLGVSISTVRRLEGARLHPLIDDKSVRRFKASDVERLAKQDFTFLADTAAARTEVVLGDARLSLEREPSQQFDILVLDAFSGDAIPTHLLTTEAFDIYMRHLKLGGILAVHFSNRSVDLGPLLLHHARRLNLFASVGDQRAGWWMLMTSDQSFLLSPQMRRGTQPVQPTDRATLWSDDHVNLMEAIRWVPN